MGRFDYLPFDDKATEAHSDFKSEVDHLHSLINRKLGLSNERYMALMRLEECFMWIGKAIKADQELRSTPIQDTSYSAYGSGQQTK